MSNYKHLSRDERSIIGHYRHQCLSLREIARRLERNVSTISREIHRNAYKTDGRYRAYHAQQKYKARLRRSREGTNFSTDKWQQVFELLAEQHSPQQISGRLKLEGKFSISHETIYRCVWTDKKKGGDLYKERW